VKKRQTDRQQSDRDKKEWRERDIDREKTEWWERQIKNEEIEIGRYRVTHHSEKDGVRERSTKGT
jgi:hypothetical protein